jgi:SAM-dependent methyltransferase
MDSFPFITVDELDAARARWDLQMPGTAGLRLRENAESILLDPAFRAPLDLRLQSNLFQIQGILFETSLAFALSGEERFLEPVKCCVEAIADERLRRVRLPNEMHLAFVLVGLAVAHELCGEAIDQESIATTTSIVTAELHAAAGREEWGDRLPKRNAWNHTAVVFSAIGCGGLLCRDSDSRAEHWLDAALERLELFFADGITDEGMTREGLAYCGFAFRHAAPLLLACRNAGIWDYRSPLENPYVERLRRVPRWYAIDAFPGGSWTQPINDSYWSPGQAMWGFLPTFGPLDPGLTAWVYDILIGTRGDGTHGRDSSLAASSLFESVLWAPAPVSADDAIELPEMLADSAIGYLAERVREAPRSCFSFNCGEFIGGIHDQSDNGSVTLFAGDVPLLIDSGAANDPMEGSASSSHGHNLVLIDGRGQFPSGQGAGCTGRIVRAERHRRATVITADLTASYAVRDYNPVRHAIRHCVFGKHPFTYLLVVDDFARPLDEDAVFDQIFHTPPVAASSREGSEIRLRIEFEGAASGLAIRPLDGDVGPEETSFTQHDTALFAEHPVWRVRRGGGHLVMPTLLLPYEDSRPPQVLAGYEPGARRVTLEWRMAGVEGLDVLEFAPGSAQAARLTRDGAPLVGAEVLFALEAGAMVQSGNTVQSAAGSIARLAPIGRAAIGRLRERGGPAHSPHVSGSSQSPRVAPGAIADQEVDEQALRRRRRLRRLVESVEALDDDHPSSDAPTEGMPARRMGQDLLEHLVAFAELDPDANVLEIGCGTGHLARPLIHYLRWGSYVGIDTREESVAWCQRELASRNLRFQFECVDMHHADSANPTSAQRLTYQDGRFDCIVVTSLFTSVSSDEAETHLEEFARVLRDDGLVFIAASLEHSGSAIAAGLERALPSNGAWQARLVVDRLALGALAGLDQRLPPDILILKRKR